MYTWVFENRAGNLMPLLTGNVKSHLKNKFLNTWASNNKNKQRLLHGKCARTIFIHSLRSIRKLTRSFSDTPQLVNKIVRAHFPWSNLYMWHLFVRHEQDSIIGKWSRPDTNVVRLVIARLVHHKIKHFNFLKLWLDFSHPVFIFCVLKEGSID